MAPNTPVVQIQIRYLYKSNKSKIKHQFTAFGKNLKNGNGGKEVPVV